MYLTRDVIQKVEHRLGVPEVLCLNQEISPVEMAMVRGSMKHGRAHDVTFFIFNSLGQVALIAKHFFPLGAYRAPSGGIDPGEDFVLGTQREAWEETGLDIDLRRYILRVEAGFACGSDRLGWTSHIVTAATQGMELHPHDHDEIREATFKTLEELQGPIRQVLWNSGLGLFRYRCALTDAAVRRIREA